jgi:riboflavin-specific deaminase-like protein
VPQEVIPGAELLSSVRRVLDLKGASLPVVTVSWAQASNGTIAATGGVRTAISGAGSMTFTHRLRALHDAILVGITTVITDDPQLNVRLVEGRQPQPVVLDSRLRFPIAAKLLARTDRHPWVFHAGSPGPAGEALQRAGAILFEVAASAEGLDLRAVLAALAAAGIRSLMVEGGARVLSSFMALGLAAQAVVTVSPTPIAGVPGPGMPRLRDPRAVTLGADTVTWGLLGA